jgi:sulfonate transport system substrate-binding protein
MKKLTATLVSIFLLLVLVGCSNNGQAPTQSAPQATRQAAPTKAPASTNAATSSASTSSASTSTAAATNKPDLSKVVLRVGAAYDIHAYLRAAGLDNTPYKVEANVFQGGNLVLEAMAANQLDFGSGSQIPPIFASQAQTGGNMKIIAIRKGSTLDQELIVPPGSPIKSVAEQKGKKVAYVKSTTAHYFLAKMLTEAGVDWKDVNTVEMTTSDGLTALLTKQVDAFASYGNSIISAKKKGATTLYSAENILSGDYYFYATPAAIADPAKHAAIVDYLNRFNDANEWTRQHPQEWANVEGPIENQDPAVYLEQFKREVAQRYLTVEPIDSATIASEQDIADTFVKIGLLTKKIDIVPLFDRSFDTEVGQFKKYRK